MFFRTKRSGNREYLQIVASHRDGERVRQRVLATLGRLDELNASGQLESLLRSGARFADSMLVIGAHERGEAPVVSARKIGAPLIFERLWRETGARAVVERLAGERQFGFSLERAVFLTVLHRLLASGSDRACEEWRHDYAIPGTEDLQLHQLYRTMGWLGEPLGAVPAEADRFALRTRKDQIEEDLFLERRDLFTVLDLVFFDTTSIYFEGAGGESLGQHGHSKDFRPDLKQMVVGVVLDNEGTPVCSFLWPGNTADVTTLVPVVDRLKTRFAIGQVCIVADRGMISRETIAETTRRGWQYILGVRMRRFKEASVEVLGRAGRYEEVHPKSPDPKDPSPLKVKEVWVEDRRYVVCQNDDQASKDRHDREAIVAALEAALARGDKSLIGNHGYRRFVKTSGKHFSIDTAKIKAEARYDGKWVLTTNTELSARDLALKYKQLWTVEAIFRTMKSQLNTRPIYHKCDDTIRGHVFCSFLALVLRKALEDRLAAAGHTFEWQRLIGDLEALQDIEIEHQAKRFVLRTQARGACGAVFQACGVALPPTLRPLAA